MQNFLFETAKNGALTCSINGKYLHSKYNPQKEAEAFANNLNFDFNPLYILITEPGISYITKILKEKFSSAKLIAIRYCHDFDEYNSDFDYVFYAENDKENSTLQNKLISRLGETNLLSTAFLQWQPSSIIFSEINTNTWLCIKDSLNFAKTSLFTKGFFSKRWFINTIRLHIFADHLYEISKTKEPVVITASGRSLENSISKLKENRKKYHLIALSSSLSVLIKNNLIPDLVLSTDGGYWAKRHLSILRKYPEIPIALSCEGNLDTFILKTNKIIPLSYSDGYSEKLNNYLNNNYLIVERNGTVSGTAIDFAKKITPSSIYVCGLDLHTSKGYQHTMPNQLENLNKRNDIKISSLCHRTSKSELNDTALTIYENWFKDSQRNFTNRVYRLSHNFNFKNNLNTIKDVNFDYFEKNEKQNIKTEFEFSKIKYSNKKNKIKDFIDNFSNSQDWIEEFFPAEYFSMNHKVKIEEKEKLHKEISEKNKRFIKKLRTLIK